MWKNNIEQDKIQPTHEEDSLATKKINALKAKKAMQGSVKCQTIHNWNTRVQKLTFQGDFIKLLIEPFLIILNHSEMHSVPKMDENIKFKARVNQFSKSWLCQKTIQFCARIQFTAMKLNNYCSVTFSLYLQLTTQYLSRVVGRSENLRGGIGKGE